MENENTSKNTTKQKNRNRESAAYGKLTWKERVPLFNSPSCPTSGTQEKQEKESGGKRRISRNSEDMLIKAWRKVLSIKNLYDEVGLSSYMGDKCKKELRNEGFVDEVEVPVNRRGRRRKFLQILPRGRQYLKEDLGLANERKGRGGVSHLYYQEKIRNCYLMNGYIADVEARIGDTSFDVLAIGKDGRAET